MFHYQYELEKKIFEVYRFPYEPVDSNMFFVPIDDTGIVFDPNENEELISVLNKCGTSHITIALTHEHYDHTNGVKWLQSRIESKLFCQIECAKTISVERGNEPKLVAFVLATRDAEDGGHRYKDFKSSFRRYSLQADITFEQEYDLRVGNIELKCLSTPGHSPGSSIFMLGKEYIFTGDSLIQNTPTILRFPESDEKLYNTKTRPFLKSLDKNMLVFPGHGEPFKINEAKYL